MKNHLMLMQAYSLTTIVLTLIHHFYGAIIYAAPFRMHVALFAIPILGIQIAAYRAYKRSKTAWVKKICLLVILVISMVFSIVAIGFFEGGYNHVVKNVLYFAGTPVAVLDKMYSSVYELPNDLVFEATGMLQFVTALFCLRHFMKIPFRSILG
jgi:hypothetical protein